MDLFHSGLSILDMFLDESIQVKVYAEFRSTGILQAEISLILHGHLLFPALCMCLYVHFKEKYANYQAISSLSTQNTDR